MENVCIIGAGPGGVATALKLSYLGIPSILIDKATFPRDKVCGDALSGKVTTLLKRLDPAILDRLLKEADPIDIWGLKFVAANDKAVEIPFKLDKKKEIFPPGLVSKRLNFDNFLIDEVKKRDNITFLEGVDIDAYEKTDNGFLLSDKKSGYSVETKLLIMANGAHSAFSRKYAGLEKVPRHYAGAVRAYYKNVKGFNPEDNFIELHFIKEFTPGYFWIFPLPNNEANIGIGMRTDLIKKRKINLKKSFYKIIEEHPVIKERFKSAEPISQLEGYGLPLGSKKQKLSGDNFMLVGDAGHLIDPLSGEGIGNAFYSGFIAAEQAAECLAKDDFSAKILTAYDKRIDRVLGSEFKISYRLQKMLSYTWVTNAIASLISRNKKYVDIVSRMYVDIELRNQAIKPKFWLKLMFNRLNIF